MQVIDWQVIVKKHGKIVWRTAYRLLSNHTDAADCFQETFVSALELCRRQRVRNFAALLARLATTRAIDRLRQRSRQALANADSADQPALASGNAGPAQQLQQQELAERLRKALGTLPPQEAEVFCLRHLNEMSYRQIAKQLGITTNATGVLLHRARATLREYLLRRDPADSAQRYEQSEVQI